MAAPWALLAASVLLSLLPFSTSDTPPPPSPPTRPPPGLPFVAINQIQGRSHYSPYNGMKVVTRGIVTGKSSTGFWMQTPDSEVDGDNATSEGIFVYRSSQAKPAVGDMVTMNGTVSEYYPAAGNLPLTELVSSSSTYKYVVLSSNNPLPTPVKLGEGGRPIPTEVIFDDRGFSVFDLARGADFYEAVEGMLIQVNQPFCVSGTSQYGEVVVLADGGRNTGSTLRSAHGGVVISATQFNPARIYLTDKLLFNASLGLAMPDCIVGDTLDSGLVTAIMDYQFNNYMAHITSGKPTIVRGSTVASVASVAAANEFTIGTFNMENFGGRAPQSKFDAIASQVVNNMRSPHILCAEEIQNTVFNTTNNTESDGVLDKLIAAIVAAGGPTTYVYRYIKPTVGTDGGEPGGDIRQVFIYQTDKVTFVDRPGGNATSNTSWALGADGTVELSASPGRLYPNDVAWTTSRKPLLGEFLVNGEKLLVVCNHFNSKGGDTSLYGTAQPPVLNSEVQRLKQAQIVNGFVTSVLSLDPAANVVVLGDLNDFSWSNPIQALKAGGVLLDLTEALLSPQERYSYVFDGNSQELDAILVSQHLFSRVSAVDVVHVNSEFPNTQQTSDHDPSVARIKYVTASGVPPPSPSLPPPSPPSPPPPSPPTPPPPSPPSPPPPSPPSLPPPSPPPVSTPPPPVVSTPPPPSPPTRPPPRSPPSSPSPRPPPRSPPPRPPLRPPPRPPRSPPPRPPPPSPPSPPPPPPTAVLASFTRFDKINLQAQILYDQGTQTADVCAVTCFADADCIAFVLSRTSAIVGTCTFMGSPVTKRRASSSVVTTFVKDPFSLYSAPLLDTGRYGGGNIVTLDAEGTGKPCAVQCVTDDTCAFVVYNPTDNTCSLKKSWSIAVRRPGQLMYKKL